MKHWIDTISMRASKYMASATAFLLALLMTLLWAVSYPIWKNGDVWMLVINTATTIISFLMGFMILMTQAKDTKAIHVKLDALIKVNKRINNKLMGIEDLSDDEIEAARAVC